MKQLETIIRDLAGVDIAELESDSTMTTVRNLVLQARGVADKLGPEMRSAYETEKSDDYQGVSQFAIALGYDGKIHTTRRTDCPDHALIPLMGALKYEVRKMNREASEKIGMNQADYDDAIDSISSMLLKGEFDAAASGVPLDGSRTDQPPKLVIPRK